MIETFKILLRHYLIGITVTVIVFWSINEIPSLYYFQLNLTEWIATIISIPLIGLLMSKLLTNRLRRTEKGLYLSSSLIIIITWVFVLYAKALIVGIVDSIEQGQEELIDAMTGFTIYQLWIYLGLGIAHGLIGGLFLKTDLKKNLKKIKKRNTTTHIAYGG